jgi:hypothetical protein
LLAADDEDAAKSALLEALKKKAPKGFDSEILEAAAADAYDETRAQQQAQAEAREAAEFAKLI